MTRLSLQPVLTTKKNNVIFINFVQYSVIIEGSWNGRYHIITGKQLSVTDIHFSKSTYDIWALR